MIYAIGDIHGQLELLKVALSHIEKDGGPDAHIVFLGDYTDRGPDSRGVLEFLIEGTKSGRNWTVIKGNHDRSFSYFVQNGVTHDPRVTSKINWLQPRLGGIKTLESYGIIADQEAQFHHPVGENEVLTEFIVDGRNVSTTELQTLAKAAVPQSHLDFLDRLPLTYETDDHIFVHAGLRPNVELSNQDPEDLLWIRQGFTDVTHDFGRLVVHGHTALETPRNFGTRVDLDGGAGYGRPILPAVFEGRDCWLLTENGREPFLPKPLLERELAR